MRIRRNYRPCAAVLRFLPRKSLPVALLRLHPRRSPPVADLRPRRGEVQIDETVPGFLGWLTTEAGPVPRISPQIVLSDRLGAWKVRWGIGRMSYIVPPGLYAVGHPSPDAPVLVTANYKMSFDLVRKVMAGRDAWILVLETFGINVWCAAGKGTFGTGGVDRTHPGDGAGEARQSSPAAPAHPGCAGCGGARSGPNAPASRSSMRTIRAEDLPEYLDRGTIATPAMRQLTFTPAGTGRPGAGGTGPCREIHGNHGHLPAGRRGSPGRHHSRDHGGHGLPGSSGVRHRAGAAPPPLAPGKELRR